MYIDKYLNVSILVQYALFLVMSGSKRELDAMFVYHLFVHGICVGFHRVMPVVSEGEATETKQRL